MYLWKGFEIWDLNFPNKFSDCHVTLFQGKPRSSICNTTLLWDKLKSKFEWLSGFRLKLMRNFTQQALSVKSYFNLCKWYRNLTFVYILVLHNFCHISPLTELISWALSILWVSNRDSNWHCRLLMTLGWLLVSYEAKISYQLLFKLWYSRLRDVPNFTKLFIIDFLGVDLTLFVVINAIAKFKLNLHYGTVG